MYDVKKLDRGYIGENRHKWSGEKELKDLLKAEFKKNGLKVSVRSERAGWHIGLNFSLKIGEEDIRSFDEYKEGLGSMWKADYGKSWFRYGIGSGDWMHWSDFESASDEVRKDVEDKFWKYHYDCDVRSLRAGSLRKDALREKAVADAELCEKIVRSYNRDESDAMVDYFCRSIYDWYHVKVA